MNFDHNVKHEFKAASGNVLKIADILSSLDTFELVEDDESQCNSAVDVDEQNVEKIHPEDELDESLIDVNVKS